MAKISRHAGPSDALNPHDPAWEEIPSHPVGHPRITYLPVAPTSETGTEAADTAADDNHPDRASGKDEGSSKTASKGVFSSSRGK